LDVCIGEKAAALVKDEFILRSVDLIIVKGKTQPVEIFTVIDKRGAAEPAWLARHEGAMRLYRAGDFIGAEKAWREVLAQVPGDGLAQTFVARCVELQANPPPGVWTGVYEMKTK
jgi:adenylate cyclase